MRVQLIWDSSHVAYGHKILTGRRDRMHTLRQTGGLSGFTKRSESIYDPFSFGHVGQAVSACVGMAVGRDLKVQFHMLLYLSHNIVDTTWKLFTSSACIMHILLDKVVLPDHCLAPCQCLQIVHACVSVHICTFLEMSSQALADCEL